MKPLKISQSITVRDTRAIDQYLTEISKTELITPDEEADLARRIRHGDQAALERLTRANLRFVVSVSKQFQHNGLPLSDLISEGNLGLMKAARRFDETKGFKFISYAVWWIRQGILQAINEQARMVRLPLNQAGALSGIKKTISVLEQQLERNPSVEEIAEAMESTASKIAFTLSNAGRHLSVDAPFAVEEEGTLLDILRADQPDTDQALTDESLLVLLRRSMSVLQPREKEIVILFFGIGIPRPESLSDIGFRFGISSERVRQLKDLALHKMRKRDGNNLQEYL